MLKKKEEEKIIKIKHTMKALFFFAFLALLLFATVATSAEVVELNQNNFHSVIGDASKDVFVVFHAPWCTHCKKLKPEFEKLGSAMDTNIWTFASFDADAKDHRALTAQYAITAFPTLLLFRKNDKGNPVKYNNPLRKFGDMRLWLLTGKTGGAMTNARL